MSSLRYAHSEGHVDLCYDESGEVIVTCGTDGDIRIFRGIDDDDPESHRAGDCALAVACSDKKLYVGADDNAVQVLNMSGDLDGIITRFTAPVNHIQINKGNSLLVAGASDFTVKLVELDSKRQQTLMEHEAPVLSVSIHPRDEFVASSACDGFVKVFKRGTSKIVKSIEGLPKCNDFMYTTTLCRMCWDKEGKFLMVPINREIKAFDTDTWNLAYVLSDEAIKDLISVSCLSSCGQYVAAGCRDGLLLVWDIIRKQCVLREKHRKGLTIAAIAWNPKRNGEIAYADKEGQLGTLEFPEQTQPGTDSNKETQDELNDLFDDGDDDMLIEATNPNSGVQNGDNTDDDDDTIVKQRKSMKRVLDDEEDNSRDFDLAKIKADTMGEFMGDDLSVTSDTPKLASVAQPLPPTVMKGFEPTPMQKAFQSSSTPSHLSNRFMMWNNVGIVTQYDTDEEQSINIVFHDTATHHAMHIQNPFNYSIADLSTEAAVLASTADEDSQSKLVCMHFGSWDNIKEWTTTMPEGEDIICTCIGNGWIAVGTDKRTIRLFSIGGIQKEIFTVPGPLVAMSGHSNQLILVYHRGLGVPGDQCLGVQLMQITDNKKLIISGDDLPLSPRSTLVWMGFTAEGSPLIADSLGIVRILNRAFCRSWTQICNLKSHCNGKSDNYWIISAHENPEQIRAVLCKGSRYPPTLPKPNVVVLPYQIPLCELSTDKSIHEETLLRGTITSNHFTWWTEMGFDLDEMAKEGKLLAQKEILMKIFALACKSDHEFRAVEICQMMPDSHTIQLAIKYASRLRRMQLAERLTHIAREKVEEELCKEDEYEVESVNSGSIEMEPTDKFARESERPVTQFENDEEFNEDNQVSKGLLLNIKKDKEKSSMPRSLTNSQKGMKNPFKVSQEKDEPTFAGIKGSSVFDKMEKSKPKPFGQAKIPNDTKPKRKDTFQGKLYSSDKKSKSDSLKAKPSESPFQSWFCAHKEELKEENPELSESDLTIVAAKKYKALSKEEQKEWKADSSICSSKKRKRSIEDEENKLDASVSTKQDPVKKRGISQSTTSKLAGFSFKKD